MDLNDIYPVILTVILLGLILGIGIFVMAELREGIAVEYTGYDSDVNITNTIGANTTTLTDASNTNYKLVSIDLVINVTGAGEVTTSDAYTTVDSGVITWSDETVAGYADGSLVNITSTYIYDGTGRPETAVSTTLSGLGNMADWIAIIIVIIAAAIIIGLVVRSFGMGTQP